MKFVKRFRKFFSILFLLITVESIVQPNISLALTTGPHQPEYTSYEQPGSTDMVNLLTGDFTFSLPILEVPGPEGNFPVPLTYNAGIGADQEASWVGLGWTLNTGAITREINQYPDDASGEGQFINNVNLVGVRGWTSACLGLGQAGWNTATGSYGAISLLGIVNYQWDAHHSSGGLIGINVGNGGVDFNAAQFGMAAITIASMGVAAELEAGAVTVSSLASQATGQLAFQAGLSSVLPSRTPSISPSDGYWAYNQKTEKQGFLHKDYWIWLDQTRTEQMYGILNLDQLQTVPYTNIYPTDMGNLDFYPNGGQWPTGTQAPLNQYSVANFSGSASDLNYYYQSDSTFEQSKSAAILATDKFSVKAPGISGSIKPYRLEVGSVSMPRQMTPNHARLAFSQYSSYKVPFIYDGLLSNSYFYHMGGATSAPSRPKFYQGLSVNFHAAQLVGYQDLTVNDFTQGSQNRIRNDLATSYKIAQANHIEWLTNSEIKNTAGSFSNGYMDYFSTSSPSPYSRSQFRTYCSGGGNQISDGLTSTFLYDGVVPESSSVTSTFQVGQQIGLSGKVYNSVSDYNNNIPYATLTAQTGVVNSIDQAGLHVSVPTAWLQYPGKVFDVVTTNYNLAKPAQGIGGFSITNPSGITYHFALPVYDYNYQTWIGDKSNPSSIYTTVVRSSPYANTWLLTGITGSDFVDRNANGVIDASDWGYWVKFNYGKYSDNYQWKLPYGKNADSSPVTMVDPTNSSLTYSQGKKQLYYLNSVETRSHVALFIKDTRNDNFDATLSTGSLKLTEISLLKREDYQALFTSNGQPNDSGTINAMWMAGNSTLANFVTQHALKRIKFTYDYSLCKATSNSVDAAKGKLTLKRVSILGGGGAQAVPDYKFDYSNANPDYGANSWDGWGMYSGSATSAYNSHFASTNEGDGSAWSLSQITTPQGSTIQVNYERDKYSSVSDMPLQPLNSWSSTVTGLPTSGISSITGNSSGINVGDQVQINGSVSFTCPNDGSPINYTLPPVTCTVSSIVVNGGATTMNLSTVVGQYPGCYTNTQIAKAYAGTVQKVQPYQLGGGVRVGSIVLNDNNRTYKTRYLYQNSDGTCSGVVAQEPPYAKTSSFDFGNIPDYPYSPVLYSQVTVLTGSLVSDADFVNKTIYSFETPSRNLVVDSSKYYNIPTSYHNSYIYNYFRNISDFTSKIGKVKSISTYDNTGALSSTSTFSYTSTVTNANNSNNYQGIYSSGAMMSDFLYDSQQDRGTWKLSRSTIVKYPYSLKTVVTTKDGFTTQADNIAWDFISGQVTEKNSTSPLGIKTKSVTQPAYSIPSYSAMGPKATSQSNANMLAQPAAEYTYRLDASGNITGLLSGQVTTWSNSWGNYREYNAQTGAYTENSGSFPSSVWRKSGTYVYKGAGYNDLQSDGTLKFNTATNQYDFSGATSNTNWMQTGSATRYDHYSMPVESKNTVTQIYSSGKRDFYDKNILAMASNSNYYEFAYSGAEDDNPSTFFGGEVARANGSIVTGAAGTLCHTGQNAVSVSPGGKSFVYKPVALTSGRTYRAIVWANTNTGGGIYYVANGTTQTPAPTSIDQVGSWYRIVVDNIPSNATEIGVQTSGSSAISFDDFKFHPRDAAVTANVYDPGTGYLTYAIGNDGLFTQYVYNASGIVTQTWVESIKYGRKLVTEKSYDYKRFHTNQ